MCSFIAHGWGPAANGGPAVVLDEVDGPSITVQLELSRTRGVAEA